MDDNDHIMVVDEECRIGMRPRQSMHVSETEWRLTAMKEEGAHAFHKVNQEALDAARNLVAAKRRKQHYKRVGALLAVLAAESAAVWYML